MSLFQFIKELHSLLHSALIKQGYVLQRFVFRVLCDFYGDDNVHYELKFTGNVSTVRKYHKIDCLVVDNNRKRVICFEVKSESTNYNIAPSAYLKQIQSAIIAVQLTYPEWAVEYIIVKYNYSKDPVYDILKKSYLVLDLKGFCTKFNTDVTLYMPEGFLLAEVKQQIKKKGWNFKYVSSMIRRLF